MHFEDLEVNGSELAGRSDEYLDQTPVLRYHTVWGNSARAFPTSQLLVTSSFLVPSSLLKPILTPTRPPKKIQKQTIAPESPIQGCQHLGSSQQDVAGGGPQPRPHQRRSAGHFTRISKPVVGRDSASRNALNCSAQGQGA